MNKHKTRRIILSAALLFTIVFLTACNSKNLDKATNEETEPDNKLIKNVSISDISIKSTDIYSINILKESSPIKGYVIEANIENKNNISCNVFPSFSILVEDKDDYGQSRKRELLLLDSEKITTPYGEDQLFGVTNAYIKPVGLAPNEIKTVKYYITGVIKAYDKQSESNNTDDSLVDSNEIQLSLQDITIDKINLASFDVVEVQDKIYLPAKENIEKLKVEHANFSFTGMSLYGDILTGFITNNTKDRWDSITLKFDYTVNDFPFLNDLTNKSFEYIPIGKSVQLSDKSKENYSSSDTFITYEEEKYKANAVPALISYVKEQK